MARQIGLKRHEIPILSVHDWQSGRLRGADDEEILRIAAQANLTLVTYDVNTIPLLLMRLANQAYAHAGVVFVSDASIRSDDIGALVRSLIHLFDSEGDAPWADRIHFLLPPP